MMIKKREASPEKAHTLDPFLADLCSKSYLEWNSSEFCFQAELEEQKWVYIRHLLLGRKAMTNLDRAFKSRNITLLTKVSIVEAMVFPVLYGWESWTIKKAECQRIDVFELWGWKRSLRVPWTISRLNQSIIKEINAEYSLEEMMLKLKFNPLATWWKELTHGKDHDAGKDWEQEEKGVTEDEMVGWYQWLNGHELEQAPGDGEGQGSLACYSPWGHKESDTTEWLNNNTATILVHSFSHLVSMTSSQMIFLLLPLDSYAVLKTAGRGILVRCKSHCASPMLKPPSGVPSHLEQKPVWLRGQTSHVGFSLPLLLPSLPLLQPSCFWLTSHPWPWCLCSGCFLCLQSFLLNARSLLPHLHQAFTYSNAIFLGSPSLALEHKL